MFVIAMTCYLVFTTIQRPELLINPDTLAQSSISFENELKKTMNISVPIKFIFIKIVNYKNINMYVGNEKFMDLLKKITVFLHELSHKEKLNASVYYLNDYVYALPTEYQTVDMINIVIAKLEEYFSHEFIIDGVKINLETRICVVRFPEDISNFEYLTYISKMFYKIIEPNGKTQWYKTTLSRQDYTRQTMQEVKKNFFDGSLKSMFSFFVKEEKLSADDIQEILNTINQEQP